MRRALASLALLAACAGPAPPCSALAAYDRGFRGLGPDPACPLTPQVQEASDRGFAEGLALRRLATTPEDHLSGRRPREPGVISVDPSPTRR